MRVTITVDVDQKCNYFIVRASHLTKEVTVGTAKFINRFFKYDSEFTNKFISLASLVNNELENIIITDRAAQEIQTLLEFNRIDS